MPKGLVQTTAQSDEPDDHRYYGIAIAQVVNNVDLAKLGRVQVRLSWLPVQLVWARVAVPMAGMARGVHFMPKIGDEVVVAFNAGDTSDPIVIGSLWSRVDPPPQTLPTDAATVGRIRTVAGQDITINDATASVTISNTTKHKVTIDPLGIRISAAAGAPSINVASNGSVSINAARISLKAGKISLDGTQVEIKGLALTNIIGGALCSIKAGIVSIN